MRQVRKTAEIAKLFASRRGPLKETNAWRPRNGNDSLYIEGDAIFSYGSHFPVALWTADGVCYVNRDRYSATTSRHQNLVRFELAALQPKVLAIKSDTKQLKELMNDPSRHRD